MEDVSQTLFYPLLGRAKAASQWPDLFPDPWATQAAHIAATEKTPAQPLGTFPTLCYGLRHLFTVREITQYLDTHPGAAVVNIGCGLDVLSEDLAGYDCTIYNLDFPTSSTCDTGGYPRLTTRLISPTPPRITNG